MQALLHGAGLCFISKGTQLNTPDRAVLHDPARHRKLLAQALLILLRPRLVAYCAHRTTKLPLALEVAEDEAATAPAAAAVAAAGATLP